MVIIKPFLPEDVRKKLLKNIKKIIANKDGKINDEDLWGKRHLAYKIDRHEEGYYVVYKIEAPGERINEIEEEIRTINDIIRYIIIKEK